MVTLALIVFALFIGGCDFLSEGDLSEAEEHYNNGVELQEQGRWNEAIAEYSEAIKLDSDLTKAYVNRCACYYQIGEYSKALQDGIEAIQLDPELAEAWNNRGNAHDGLGQYERAIQDYNEAIRLNPEDADYYYNRGGTYGMIGQYQQAIEDLDEAIRRDIQMPAQAYAMRGAVYAELGQNQKAIADLEKALDLVGLTQSQRAEVEFVLEELKASIIEANFEASTTSPEVGVTVHFTCQSTNAYDWEWDFDADGSVDSYQQNPWYAYRVPGVYSVSLRVEGRGGEDVETKANYITVYGLPTPAFVSSQTIGDPPLTVQFTDQSTGSVTQWLWQFGDGQTSTEQNPSHTYTMTGTYTVSLTATNFAGSDTEEKTDHICVCNPPVWVARHGDPEQHVMAQAIAVDGLGNVYITGCIGGGPHGPNPLVNAEGDCATVKYDSEGNELWSTRYSGPENSPDTARALAVDDLGSVYITGTSTVKYDPDGNELWVARYSGLEAQDIAVDGSGNVYVTGLSWGSGTEYDYATVKYDPDGNELWSVRYNGPRNRWDEPCAIAVDGSGNVYVTGYSPGNDTGSDYATLKYNADGNELWIARYNGPANANDEPHDMAVDGMGNVYVTGSSCGADAMDSGRDYATIKYDPDGNELWVARYNGPGNSRDRAQSIAVDGAGNVYVTGDAAVALGNSGYATIKYDPDGNELWVARYNGPGNSGDYAQSIAVAGSGNVYVTGYSWGGEVSSYEGYDYATVKYSSDGNEVWLTRYDGPANSGDEAQAIAVDGWGNVYVTGSSMGSNDRYDYVTIKYS